MASRLPFIPSKMPLFYPDFVILFPFLIFRGSLEEHSNDCDFEGRQKPNMAQDTAGRIFSRRIYVYSNLDYLDSGLPNFSSSRERALVSKTKENAEFHFSPNVLCDVSVRRFAGLVFCAWRHVATRRNFKRRAGAARRDTTRRDATWRPRGVARASGPVTNRVMRFERVAVTSAPVTSDNWANRGHGVAARHSGRGGTPDP